MTDLTPTPALTPVPQLETNTLALGGTGNPMNQQAQALLNRAEYLRQQIEGILSEIESLGEFDTDLENNSDLTKGSAKVGWNGGTVAGRLGSYVVVTDGIFGAVADGITDNTAAILDAAISVAPNGVVYIPYNVNYNFNALLDDVACPPNVQFIDEARIPAAGGAKLSGWFEKGDSTSVGDASETFSSGHNMTMNLDNHGKSGSASGDKRIVVIAWTGGRMSGGATPGLIRSISRYEMAHSAVDLDRWSHVIRKRAPWEAVAANYNRWISGESVDAGAYTFRNPNYYTTAAGGVTGSTPPTHTAGTVSDGGVDWTYVPFNYDASILYIDDLGRVGLNTAPATGSHFMRLRQDPNDLGPYTIAHEPVGPSKSIQLTYFPTDAGGASTGTKQIQINTTGFTFLIDGNTAGAFLSTGFNQRQLVKVTPTAANGDTTPTVLNIGSLLFSNASPTNVTTLDDGVANQQVELVFSNGNTTLVHSASFVLVGAVNVTPTTHSVITMRKVSYSSAWIEVSRSIK